MGGSRGIIEIPDTGRNASPLFRVPRLANALMTISCKSNGTLINQQFSCRLILDRIEPHFLTLPATGWTGEK
jgi:hypothetical protein